MYVIAILVLAASALAAPVPAPSAAQEMHILFSQSENCKLPDPINNCAGAIMSDVILQYGKNFTKDEKELFLNAARSSGAEILHDWPNFGFSGFVPEQVVSLLDAHSSNVGGKLWKNACYEIPWCGEAPC